MLGFDELCTCVAVRSPQVSRLICAPPPRYASPIRANALLTAIVLSSVIPTTFIGQPTDKTAEVRRCAIED